jgi:hypothetical protein
MKIRPTVAGTRRCTGQLAWPGGREVGAEDHEHAAFARKHGYRPDEAIAMIEAIS